MITRIGMAPRRDGMSTAAFVEHWRTAHADVASHIPGLRRYVQLHPVLVDGRRPLPYPGFDACSLLDFDSVEAMSDAFASSTYTSSVRADEARFIDGSRHSLVVGSREVSASLPDGSVLLATFLRRQPEASSDAFRAALDAWTATPGGCGVELYVAVSPAHGARPNAADALSVRGFADAGEALAWDLSDAGGERARYALAGPVFGTATFLARPHQIV